MFTRTVRALAAASCCLSAWGLASAPASAQPANDLCSQATDIAVPSALPGSTIGATLDAGA